jgi:DNA primase
MIIHLWETPDALAYLTDRGLSEETILEAQLGLGTEGVFRGWIAIPYFDGQGRWRMNRYRSLPPTEKAYRYRKGDHPSLYNVGAVDEPVVAICEGEFDSLILRQLGLPAVALPGVNQWRREWRWLFRNSDLVYIFVDHARETEEDARNAERRAMAAMRATIGMVTDVEPVEMPEGMDITDLYLQDPDRLKELMT